MAQLVDANKLPPGWLFGLKWKTWVGGVIAAELPFANNATNKKLVVTGVTSGEWSKPFFAVGAKSTDVSYDTSTNTITFSTGLVAKGWGFDTLGEACDKIRSIILADSSPDPGDLKTIKTYLATLGTMWTT